MITKDGLSKIEMLNYLSDEQLESLAVQLNKKLDVSHLKLSDVYSSLKEKYVHLNHQSKAIFNEYKMAMDNVTSYYDFINQEGLMKKFLKYIDTKENNNLILKRDLSSTGRFVSSASYNKLLEINKQLKKSIKKEVV